MRIGIYNRWLATLGGGEKYCLAVAEHLSRDHVVEVITHKPVSKELAAQRLNLDLSQVQFVCIPDRPSIELTPLTAEYDLFICASFLDLFASRAARSAMIVFFPTPLSAEPVLRFRRRVGLVLKRWLMLPSFTDGVLSTEILGQAQRRQARSRVTIQLPPAPREYTVSFDLAACDQSSRSAKISLDDRVISHTPLSATGASHCQVVVPASRRAIRSLTIDSEQDSQSVDSPVKMILTCFQIDHLRYRLYRVVFERWFRQWGLKLYRIPSNVTPFLESVMTYDAIWAISKFTQSWVKSYWNIPSQILYPPVDTQELSPAPKQNRILNVGRFFLGSHNKKHLEMIAAFKQMVDDGLTGWEFHLAGGLAPGEENENYIGGIKKASLGYPIFIHPDISRQRLLDLYASSAIYWHASGYGEDEAREPIRFEHFGITTVEAMAAGCVPVVISKGGQKEVVRHNQNGYLWQTIAELRNYTVQLIENKSLLAKLAAAAINDSKLYDKDHFEARLDSILKDMGIVSRNYP